MINIDKLDEKINEIDFSQYLEFAKLQRLRLREAESLLEQSVSFGNYSKRDIIRFLQHPTAHEGRLRDVSRALYESSGHYRRLVNYFADLVLFSYIVVPRSINSIDKRGFIETAKRIDRMNLRQEGNKLLRTLYRDGIVYGYAYSSSDSFTIQILDPKYCRVSSVEDGCLCYEFDLGYFDLVRNNKALESFAPEFREKYEIYKSDNKGRSSSRWQEIGQNGICIKATEDILSYSLPPFVGVFEEIFDIQDYKQLAKAKEEANNYNLINLTIPMKDDRFQVDSATAKRYYDDVARRLPEYIGAIMTPFETEKFDFTRPKDTNNNAVKDATSQFYSSAGVSELLFGGYLSSANAISHSVLSDEAAIFIPVRQIERWINRRLKMGKLADYKIQVLDATVYNKDKLLDYLLKAGNTGAPVKMKIAAILGYSPLDILTMGDLENNVLMLRDTAFGQPLKSANTMSSLESEGGRPSKPDDELSDEGEQTRDDDSNQNRGDTVI